MDVSVLIPTKNEELVISQFIDWCEEGFREAGVTGEIVLADNSQDRTAEIAISRGVTVIKVHEAGVGRAYRVAAPYVTGKVVILGDADCTYDFRKITPFLKSIEAGSDFVIGSRFRGKIQKRSMPIHHRYFGSPLTTLFFDLVHGVRYSDIHCGMRAMKLEVFKQLIPQESGWQYASEMLARARHLGITSSEVPINFFVAPNQRLSHLKRGGWKVPFQEGIGTLVTALKYASDRLFHLIGITALLVGLPLLVLSISDTSRVGIVQFSFGAQILGLGLSCIGTTCLAFSRISKVVYGSDFSVRDIKSAAAQLRRLFLIWCSVLLGTFSFGSLYTYEYFHNIGQSLDFFKVLSRMIGPVVFLNYYLILKILTGSLQLFILEKNNK
jgi:glycosyltransferase involved in cell wall biosynthesis